MRKKHVMIIFWIGLFVFGSLYFVKIQTGRNLFGYISRKIRGEYETYITVSKFEDSERGYYTEYAGDRYLYFDDGENIIYDYETKEKLIEAKGEINSFCANNRYIFFIKGTSIFQCGFNGEVHGMVDIPDDERLSFIYVDEQNLYCEGEKGFYFLSAENITGKQEPVNMEENSEKRTVRINGAEIKFWFKSRKGILLGFETERLEDIKEVNDRGYIKVYTDKQESYLSILLLPQRTGKEVAYRDSSCIGIFEGEMYFVSDKIYCLTESKQYIKVKNSPVYGNSDIQYLSNIRSGNYLIVLSENYYYKMPGGSSNTGSVGDFMEADICLVDLKKKKTVKEYHIYEGQVIYMSDSQYAILKDGIIKFYRMKDNMLIKTEKIKEYKTGQDYLVEVCHDKLFFIGEEGVLQVIDTDSVSM